MYRESHENSFSKKLAAKVMKEFCESTSLHGYSHLYIADNIISKIVWFLVILFTTSLGLFLFVKNTNDYFTARIVTNIETSSANLSVSKLNTIIKTKYSSMLSLEIWYFVTKIVLT